jgi:hypothetical protein
MVDKPLGPIRVKHVTVLSHGHEALLCMLGWCGARAH